MRRVTYDNLSIYGYIGKDTGYMLRVEKDIKRDPEVIYGGSYFSMGIVTDLALL